MKIILINHYAGSPFHGMEYRPFFLSREWVRLGHEVTIIASSCSHVRTREPEISGWQGEEAIEGVKYLWLKTPKYHGNGIRRILNMLVFLLQLLRVSRRVAQQEIPDVVIASSTYPLDIYPAFLLARRSAARLMFEVHDLWPLSPKELGGYSKWHPFIMAMQFAEDFAYRNAETVISMLPCAMPHMKARGLDERKLIYIPNGVVLSENKQSEPVAIHGHVQVIRELKANGQFVVLYAGAHGVANALDSMVDAANLVRDLPITFVLVGQGPEKARIQKRCDQLDLPNVKFLPSVARTEVMEILREADVLYISLQRHPLFRFGVSPNKLFDYMMAGRPIIQAIEAGNDIVGESECGITIAPEDPAALLTAVELLIAMDESERSRLGRNGQQYVTTHHDYRKLAQRFPFSATVNHRPCPVSDPGIKRRDVPDLGDASDGRLSKGQI